MANQCLYIRIDNRIYELVPHSDGTVGRTLLHNFKSIGEAKRWSRKEAPGLVRVEHTLPGPKAPPPPKSAAEKRREAVQKIRNEPKLKPRTLTLKGAV